ncbi:unnamed protein product [Lampetra planeri]
MGEVIATVDVDCRIVARPSSASSARSLLGFGRLASERCILPATVSLLEMREKSGSTLRELAASSSRVHQPEAALGTEISAGDEEAMCGGGRRSTDKGSGAGGAGAGGGGLRGGGGRFDGERGVLGRTLGDSGGGAGGRQSDHGAHSILRGSARQVRVSLGPETMTLILQLRLGLG